MNSRPDVHTENSQTNRIKLILFAASKIGAIMFRQNTGVGWTGKTQHIREPMSVNLMPGDVVIRGARPLHAGLCVGSSDAIGFKMVKITQAHVGCKAAIFCAIEDKGGKDTLRPEQETFIKAVLKAGGIAGVARSEADAIALLNAWPIKYSEINKDENSI